MGLTTQSIHCLVGEPGDAKAIAAVEAATRRRLEARGLVPVVAPEAATTGLILVHSPGPWLSIFGAGLEHGEELAAALSRELGTPTVSLAVFDSDDYRIGLFRGGKSVARLSGGAGRSKAPKIAPAWLELMPAGSTLEELAAALAVETTFAEELVRELATRLGIDPDLCLRAEADLWAELPPGGRRLLYRTPAAEAAEPPRFRLMTPAAPIALSVGEPLGSLGVGALNVGGAANGLRVRVAVEPTVGLEVEEIAVVRFPETSRPDAPPERIAATPRRTPDGALEIVFDDRRVPGAPRAGGIREASAGWRAAAVQVNLGGRAGRAGSGALSISIEPVEGPAGAAVATIPVEIVEASRRPLRAMAGREQAARDLAEPTTLLALAALRPDRGAAAPAVRAVLDGWLAALGGTWSVFVQRTPLDFEAKVARVNAERRAKSQSWAAALDAVDSCRLLWGALDADPLTFLGRAAFVLDASSPALGATSPPSPQLCLWTRAEDAPANAAATLRELLAQLVERAPPFQAFVAGWNWRTLALGVTPYETACGADGGIVTTSNWCARYLRGVGEAVWVGRELAARLDRKAVEAAARLDERADGWWVELADSAGLDDLERALAPALAGRDEWLGAMRG